MNFLAKLQKVLIRDEALKLKVYPDHKGILTLGVGRNVQEKGISPTEAMFLLNNDINEATSVAIKMFPNFNFWSEPRRIAVLSMIFNLGETRFRGFKQMIEAILADDWKRAALEAKESKWATDVGTRDDRIVKMMVDEAYDPSYNL